MDCPLSKLELGNGTWTILHSIAAHAPEVLSEKQKIYYNEFFETFPLIYPCRPCAVNFQEFASKNPPTLNTRAEISIWLCKVHNIINRMLGKPEFFCTLKNLDLRWRKGPVECYEYQDNTKDQYLVY